MSNRDALLRGARACLEEQGYARTTARDLVAASGTNLASIGYHFGSKEALLNEAVFEGMVEWTAQLAQISFASPDAPPLDRLTTAMKAMLDTFQARRPLLVAFVEAMAQVERSDTLRAQLADQYQQVREEVAQLIDASFDREAAAGGVDTQVIASFLIAVCDGFLLQWLTDPARTPTGDQLEQSVRAARLLALAKHS